MSSENPNVASAGSVSAVVGAVRRVPDCAVRSHSWIGFLNHLFLWPESYRRTGRAVNFFLLDKKTAVVPGGLAGEQSGGARKVPYGAARSNSERAAPSACVGKRFSGPQIVRVTEGSGVE